MALPPLREELDLLAGPLLPDGAPSWTLHDPARNQFVRIDWPTFEVLKRWHLDDPAAIARSISAETTLHLDAADVQAIVGSLVGNQLVRPLGAQAAREMAGRLVQRQGSIFSWLLHHYLFFRIPLLRPDAWLTRWQGVARRLFTPGFSLLSLLALALGLFQVSQQWEHFLSSLVDTFNLDGLMSYGLAVIAVKVLHELGHAFTAKLQGCRVPTMGVAFLVMWPVAYTDTNETWRLTDRKQRLRVASAGILTELHVAAWATLAWGLLPEGGLKSAAFVLATTSWVATLAVNASPFMRFDGYFILSDWLDISNLHERSFALARWRLREALFDLREPPPEHFSPARTRALIAFACVTLAYRLVLFLGIAVLVYYMFFKVLGVLLFGVEILWFVIFPIIKELREWGQRGPVIAARQRGRVSLLLLLLIVGLTFVPWPTRVTATGILRPAEVWPVFAPGGGRIDELNYQEGSLVPEGSVLLRMFVPDLQMRQASSGAKVQSIQWQATAAEVDPQARGTLRSLQESLNEAKAEERSLRAESLQFAPRAPFAGRLRNLDPDLKPGQWVSRKESIAILVRDDAQWLAETWLDEETIQRLSLGDNALFMTGGPDVQVIPMELVGIDRDASRVLPRAELAAQAGGHVLVREKSGQLVPERAVYHVTFKVAERTTIPQTILPLSWRGNISIQARAQAPALRYLRRALSVVIQELGV